MKHDYSKPLTIDGLHNLYRMFKANNVMSFTQSFLDYTLACDLGYATAFNLGCIAVAFKVSSDLYNSDQSHLLDPESENDIIEMLNSFEGLVEFCIDSIAEAKLESTITLQ